METKYFDKEDLIGMTDEETEALIMAFELYDNDIMDGE